MLDQQHVSVAKAALRVFGMAPTIKSPDSRTWCRGRGTTSKPSAVQMLKPVSERNSGRDTSLTYH